jgi:hypothetical protein
MPFWNPGHRVRVVVAQFVTSRLPLGSNFIVNCQQKFYFWQPASRNSPEKIHIQTYILGVMSSLWQQMHCHSAGRCGDTLQGSRGLATSMLRDGNGQRVVSLWCPQRGYHGWQNRWVMQVVDF